MLSATMPMVEDLVKYLNAKHITLEHRPVRLEIETIEIPPPLGRGSRPYYHAKLREIVRVLKRLKPEEAPVLIYVPAKSMCEEIARELKKASSEVGWYSPEEVVYHHAGLPIHVRREIENELKKPNPKYKIVVATDTLSQSVNFAFRTVIVPGLKLFLPGEVRYVEPATIVQVLGRAGRPGYSNVARGIIIYTPDEKEIVEKVLARQYGTVRGLGDYYALPIRLAYTGKNVEVWARYAPPFIDVERLREGLETARRIGLMEGTQLTPLGRALAREYAPSTVFPLLVWYVAHGGLKELERMNFENRALASMTLSLALGYLLHKLWSNEKFIEQKKLEATPPPLTPAVPEESNADLFMDYSTLLELSKIAMSHGVSRTEMLEPDVLDVLYVLYNPHIYPADMLAEACRKGAQIVKTLAEEGLIPREYERYGRALMTIFKTYRKLLKYPQTGAQLARRFLETALKPENIEAIASGRVRTPLDTLFIYMLSMGETNFEKAEKAYQASLRRYGWNRNRGRSERLNELSV